MKMIFDAIYAQVKCLEALSLKEETLILSFARSMHFRSILDEDERRSRRAIFLIEEGKSWSINCKISRNKGGWLDRDTYERGLLDKQSCNFVSLNRIWKAAYLRMPSKTSSVQLSACAMLQSWPKVFTVD